MNSPRTISHASCFFKLRSISSSYTMYRKCAFNVLFYATPSRQTRPINGPVLDSSTTRRCSTSQPSSRRSDILLTWPVNDSPTPYEVMGMEPSNSYSKSRFYSLVKLYHPDSLVSPASKNLTKEERLVRYRLIVDAHLILSDDLKRSAYDQYGLGWSLKSSPISGASMRYGYQRRGHRYSEHSGNSEESEIIWRLLSRNKHFRYLLLVVLAFAQVCLFLSLVTQAQIETRRIDKSSRKLLHHHQDRALSTRSFMAQAERILLKRDPSGLGVTPFEKATYREMLPYCTHA